MISCCQATEGDSACKRITDGKEFDLPRKYSKKRCMSKIAGFTMRASCAPYKGCKKVGGGYKWGNFWFVALLLVEARTADDQQGR